MVNDLQGIEKDDMAGLNSRLERYAKAKKRSSDMAEYLSLIGEKKISNRLCSCGSYLLFRDYYTISKVRLISAFFCKWPLLCPLCALRRSSKIMTKYLERFYNIKSSAERVLYYQLVTLTVKNGSDLKERFNHLSHAVQILRQRKKNSKRKNTISEWSKVLGLVGSYEVTNKGNGWHPHCHMIVISSKPLSEYLLKGEWYKITKDSHQVNVSPLLNPDDPLKDFCEVFKYSLKFTDLSYEHNYQAFKFFYKRQLLFSQGLFRGISHQVNLVDSPLTDLPYIELLYAYSTGLGYTLIDRKNQN